MIAKVNTVGITQPFVTVLDEEENSLTLISYVSIPAREYRELCGKASLWDEYRADAERWCEGGDA
ncbi:hypothetical protein [Thermophilibacter sp.]